MRRRVKCCILLRIHFSTANQKIQIYFRYQSYTRRNFKKNRGALGTRLGQNRRDKAKNSLHMRSEYLASYPPAERLFGTTFQKAW